MSKSDALLDGLDPDAELGPASLEFQSFSTNSAPAINQKSPPALSTTPQPRQNPQVSIRIESSTGQAGADATGAQQSSAGKPFWTLGFYQGYFEVETSDVLKRTFSVFIPKEYLFDLMAGNAGNFSIYVQEDTKTFCKDLYGPFWIATTFILLIFVTGTIRNMLYVTQNGGFKYPFEKVGYSASVVYSMVTIVPLFMWLLMKYWTGIKISLVEVIATYGYPIAIWCVCLILTIYTGVFFKTVVGLAGLGLTSFVLVRNYYPLFATIENAQNQQQASKAKQLSTGTIVLLIMIGTWVGFFFTFMFLFTDSAMAKK